MSYLGTPVPKDYKVNTYEFIAEAGQTIFPCVYTSYVDVYLNGFLLSENDYTATSKVDIVLNQACSGDELVSIRTYSNIIGGLSVYFEDILETPNTISGYGITDAVDKINITGNTVGSATQIPVITYNDQGQITNTSTASIDSLPDQTDNAGKYLTTDGSAASWATLNVSGDIANAVSALVDSAPTTLDTLNELAAALGDDANFSTTVATNIGNVSSNLSSHTSNTSNPHSVTASQVGLGNVENKSSATIRSEITSSNVTTALGFTPQDSSTAITTSNIGSQSVNYANTAGNGVKGGGSDAIFIENGQTVTTDYTITTGKNAGTFGPISIASGVTVTVPSGSVWTIV